MLDGGQGMKAVVLRDITNSAILFLKNWKCLKQDKGGYLLRYYLLV